MHAPHYLSSDEGICLSVWIVKGDLRSHIVFIYAIHHICLWVLDVKLRTLRNSLQGL